MDLCFKSATIALVVSTFCLFIPTSAFAYSSAPLTVCNKTSLKLMIAYGYHSPGVNDPVDHSILTGPFVSQGWITIKGENWNEPPHCATIPNPFGARYMYWFVVSEIDSGSDHALAMRNDAAPVHFCVDNYLYPDGPKPVFSVPAPAFTYEDENVSPAACDRNTSIDAHNFWITPRQVDTWVNATVDYTPEMVGKAN